VASGAALASVGAALLLGGPAQAQTTSCPSAPADFEPPLPNDAAIETRELRQDLAAACAAIAGAVEAVDSTLVDGVALDEESSSRLDLAWWGAWAIVGTLLALMVAPMMGRAFRWWRE
jgi:drug/metabolite transporter (DMT)-like permease